MTCGLPSKNTVYCDTDKKVIPFYLDFNIKLNALYERGKKIKRRKDRPATHHTSNKKSLLEREPKCSCGSAIVQ